MTAARHVMEPARPFPFAPLLAVSGERSWHRLALRIGVSGSTMKRALVEGCTDWQADRWACSLGLHPTAVWGNDWFELAPMCDDEESDDG